jgi:hypothetical protein
MTRGICGCDPMTSNRPHRVANTIKPAVGGTLLRRRYRDYGARDREVPECAVNVDGWVAAWRYGCHLPEVRGGCCRRLHGHEGGRRLGLLGRVALDQPGHIYGPILDHVMAGTGENLDVYVGPAVFGAKSIR